MKAAAKRRTWRFWLRHPRQRFHQDFFGQLRADAHAHLANLADDIRLLAEKLDFLFFTESHLAKPMGHFRRGRKLLDSHSRPRAHLAQGARKWLAALRFRTCRMRI